jgi:glycosyltransferase involved in cell wall biosynthesis
MLIMKLSVTIITYNHERYISQAIDSILAQRVNFDYEIVIGEDCSTDRTRAVIMDFQRRYPDRIVTLLRDRNIGVMRNFAGTIEACRGQYVAFLEGDDYWTATDKLQKQVDFLDAHLDFAICCHRVQSLYEAGSENFDVKFKVFPPRPAGLYTIEDLLRGNFVMTCSTVLRRELISPFPKWFFEMKLGDWGLCAMVARHGKIELMDETMATYRVHPGCTWSSLPETTRLRESARMLRALDKELRYQYTDAILEAVAAPYLQLAIAARLKGRRAETGHHLLNCVRNGGLRLPGTARTFIGLATYMIIGPGYKMFSRLKDTPHANN